MRSTAAAAAIGLMCIVYTCNNNSLRCFKTVYICTSLIKAFGWIASMIITHNCYWNNNSLKTCDFYSMFKFIKSNETRFSTIRKEKMITVYYLTTKENVNYIAALFKMAEKKRKPQRVFFCT